jgi:hypothetical protein
MELTYMVRGADGKDYGPVTLGQLNTWINEGRLHGQQLVKRSDMEHWATADSFSELPFAAAPIESSPVITAPVAATVQVDPAAAAQLKSGASWFYWIAGLSMINSIAAFAGSTWRFILGLGITQILDGLGSGMSGGGKVIVFVLDLLAAGVLILLGVFAHKAHTWAFIVGMVLLVLDGLIFVLVQDWLGVGFHAFLLYCLFRGFSACRRIRGA